MWLDEADAEFLSTPSARRATDIDEINTHIHKLFLSTPSARRATRNELEEKQAPAEMISIHALREEGDSKNRDKISIFL